MADYTGHAASHLIVAQGLHLLWHAHLCTATVRQHTSHTTYHLPRAAPHACTSHHHTTPCYTTPHTPHATCPRPHMHTPPPHTSPHCHTPFHMPYITCTPPHLPMPTTLCHIHPFPSHAIHHIPRHCHYHLHCLTHHHCGTGHSVCFLDSLWVYTHTTGVTDSFLPRRGLPPVARAYRRRRGTCRQPAASPPSPAARHLLTGAGAACQPARRLPGLPPYHASASWRFHLLGGPRTFLVCAAPRRCCCGKHSATAWDSRLLKVTAWRATHRDSCRPASTHCRRCAGLPTPLHFTQLRPYF